MTTILAILITILGAALGSFLSVIIYRTKHKKKGIIFSRSFCPACKKKIKWKHLIPVFSWLGLRGKCAYCGNKIAPHYFLLELTAALVFLITFFQFNFLEISSSSIDPSILSYTINGVLLEKFIFYIIELSILLAIFFYDALYLEIPDRFSLTAIAIGLAGGIVIGEPSLINMIIGGLGIGAFFLLQFLISNGTWIGGGDIRLGALIGVLLGWELGILAIILSYFVGAIYSVYLLATTKAGRKTQIAFGPFLVIGTMLTLWYGPAILDYYLSTLLI